jgi:hypothetical protein
MPTPASIPRCYELSGVVFTFLMAHPGCVDHGAGRRYYDDAFRRFILELREQYLDLDLDDFADATLVPLDTLEEWIGRGTDTDTGEHGPGQELPSRTRS